MQKRYKHLDLPFEYDFAHLKQECIQLLSHPDAKLAYEKFSQLGLTSAHLSSKNAFLDGVGSLDYDYNNWNFEDEQKGLPPPANETPYGESDFTLVNPQLKGSVLEEIIRSLQESFGIGRTRLMYLGKKQCLSWHVDSTPRLHIPIIVNDRCRMVWDDCVLEMKEGLAYWVDTTLPHTVFNGGLEERVHFVASLPALNNC